MSLANECAKCHGLKIGKAVDDDDDMGNYFVLAMVFPTSKLIMSLEESPTMYRAEPTTRSKHTCRNARHPASGRSSPSARMLVAVRTHERTLAQRDVDARPVCTHERTLAQREVDARPLCTHERTLVQREEDARPVWTHERTLVQREEDARPVDARENARPARSGRSSSKYAQWTLVQRRRPTKTRSGRSSSEDAQWTLVQRGHAVDARPAS